MPLTPEQQRERRLAMYGIDDIEAYYLRNCGGAISSPQIAAVSVLSDVQELLSRNPGPAELEKARQWINISKWIVMHKQPSTR